MARVSHLFFIVHCLGGRSFGIWVLVVWEIAVIWLHPLHLCRFCWDMSARCLQDMTMSPNVGWHTICQQHFRLDSHPVMCQLGQSPVCVSLSVTSCITLTRWPSPVA
jgi:hypothetical protein